MIALGLDPGVASFGWGVVDVANVTVPLGDELGVLELGVIRTKKGKGKILVRDDDHRRMGEISRALLDVTRRYRPDVICAEAFSMGGGGAAHRVQISTVAKMGRVWGLVDMLCELYGVALLQTRPQDIKKRLTGRQSATKLDVQEALDERLEGQLAQHLAAIRAKTQHEHPVDAIGSIVALLDHDHFRLARTAHARASQPMEASL